VLYLPPIHEPHLPLPIAGRVDKAEEVEATGAHVQDERGMTSED